MKDHRLTLGIGQTLVIYWTTPGTSRYDAVMKRSQIYTRILIFVAIISILVTVVMPAVKLLNTRALDLKSYYIAGHLALAQQNVYDPMLQSHIAQSQGLGTHFYPYIYFPMLALIWMPFATLSFPVVQWIWFILSTICLYGSMVVLWSLTRRFLPGIPETKNLHAAVIVLTCFILEGVYTNAINGQINALILLLLVLFLAAIQTDQKIPAGICLGLLIMIKPQPAILIPYLFLVRQTRTALSAFLTAAAGTAITAWIIGWDNFMYYFNEVAPTFNMIKTSFPPILIQAPPNTSIQGMITRLFLMSPFTQPVVTIEAGVMTIIRAVVIIFLGATFYQFFRFRKRQIPFLQLWLECGWLILLSLLISPLTWSHHYTLLPVLSIPLLLISRLQNRHLLFIFCASCWIVIAVPMFQMSPWILNSQYVHLALSFQTICMISLYIITGWCLIGRSLQNEADNVPFHK